MTETRAATVAKSPKSLPRLLPLEDPELFFALIGPLGTDLELVIDELRLALQDVRYETKTVRLSQLIGEVVGCAVPEHEDERIELLMRAGTFLREQSDVGEIAALLGVAEIRRIRAETTRDANKPCARTAYIIRSLKRPEEVRAFRYLYGRAFFAISVYSPREHRIEALSRRIASSKHHFNAKQERSAAERLVGIDEQEEGRTLGQDVEEAFPGADLFLDSRSKQRVRKSVRRFIEMVFGFPFHTPNKDEFAMYHAKSAALRSADLSRQVGASIATREGDIIAVGCNEVPRYGGGLYWTEDKGDARDFVRGFDPATRARTEMVGEAIDRFGKNGWLAPKFRRQKVDRLVASLSTGEYRNVLKGTQLMSVLEFGRSVHAEMAALTDAARRGVQIKGATLYSTTFPCHLCARHVIAAGIERVVYIEPYPKSKAEDLYSDSIAVDKGTGAKDRVSFEPFVGVAPRQYLELFEMLPKRKDDMGNAIKWIPLSAKPRLQRFVLSYILLEQKATAEILPELFRFLAPRLSAFSREEVKK